jgi:hypothetical protein
VYVPIGVCVRLVLDQPVRIQAVERTRVAPSGSNFEPVRATEMLFRNVRTNGFSSGDIFTIFVAPSWTIFAWSFFVAAE